MNTNFRHRTQGVRFRPFSQNAMQHTLKARLQDEIKVWVGCPHLNPAGFAHIFQGDTSVLNSGELHRVLCPLMSWVGVGTYRSDTVQMVQNVYRDSLCMLGRDNNMI